MAETWKAIKERAAAEVSADDGLRMLFPALSGGRDSGHGLTLMPFGTLFRVADRAAQGVRSKRSLEECGFALRPRMIVGVGDREIFVWSARKYWAYGRWRMGRMIGRIPLEQIATAEAPTVGKGWRTLVVQLTGKSPASLRVPSAVADELAGYSSRGPSEHAPQSASDRRLVQVVASYVPLTSTRSTVQACRMSRVG